MCSGPNGKYKKDVQQNDDMKQREKSNCLRKRLLQTMRVREIYNVYKEEKTLQRIQSRDQGAINIEKGR